MANKPFSSYLVPLYQNESMQNLSYENGFVLYENESVGETHFHMNGYVQRLVLTQRQKSTRKFAYFHFPYFVHYLLSNSSATSLLSKRRGGSTEVIFK